MWRQKRISERITEILEMTIHGGTYHLFQEPKERSRNNCLRTRNQKEGIAFRAGDSKCYERIAEKNGDISGMESLFYHVVSNYRL